MIGQIRQFIRQGADEVKYRQRPQDFTRDYILTFTTTTTLILSNLTNSLSVELIRFFSKLKLDPQYMVTKSAFSQARKKVRPLFFSDLFEYVVKCAYKIIKVKRWRGFRLWAMDGSGLRLPDIEALGDLFGWHKNQHNRVPSARLRGIYDVLNHLCVRIDLKSRHEDELTTAQDWVSDQPKDVLMIYDRGYFGFNLPWLHHHYGTHYLLRCPLGATRSIQAFLASHKKSQVVDFVAGDRSTRSMRKRNLPLHRYTKVTVRLIRVELGKDQPPEVLMTNLLDHRKYPTRLFKKLYFLRWGIETYWDRLKNIFAVGSFSGYSQTAIWQDLYATVIATNLQSILCADCQKKLNQINSNRYWNYQINRNISAGLIKDYFVKLLLKSESKIKRWLQELLTLMLQNLERIVPNQSRPRNFKIMDRKRHETEKNYRRV
ncbi:MAG: IS4 family transposase [Saprospiraceae bacterium]